jgi:NtrC-family two-component system response regulator AlgB
MQRTLELAQRAAPTDATVLITGENGTGKSSLAADIHRASARRDHPFVTVTCPCLQPQLLESELFGHVRGAFTGAIRDTEGKVAAAAGGTLLLDEVSDLPAPVQPKLLRLLQERTYERVGDHVTQHADIRVIATTNRDLAQEVRHGRMREDLYYRLNVIRLDVPPLRERRDEIMAIAEAVLAELRERLQRPLHGFSPAARELLCSHSWPGNVRELRNTLERAAVLATGPWLDLAEVIEPAPASLVTLPPIGSPVSVQQLTDLHIGEVIARSSNLAEAARVLGINKSTLYRWRCRHGAAPAARLRETVVA